MPGATWCPAARVVGIAGWHQPRNLSHITRGGAERRTTGGEFRRSREHVPSSIPSQRADDRYSSSDPHTEWPTRGGADGFDRHNHYQHQRTSTTRPTTSTTQPSHQAASHLFRMMDPRIRSERTPPRTDSSPTGIWRHVCGNKERRAGMRGKERKGKTWKGFRRQLHSSTSTSTPRRQCPLSPHNVVRPPCPAFRTTLLSDTFIFVFHSPAANH